MRKIRIPVQHLELFVGRLDENLKSIERVTHAKVAARGDEIFIDGTEEVIQKAEDLIQHLLTLLEGGYMISNGDIRTASKLLEQDPDVNLRDFFQSRRIVPSTRKTVYPKSFTQKKYIDTMQSNDLV
ncbi:MAG TPA: KH domain-containing protein, partial [Acidobacteriota bacterium]